MDESGNESKVMSTEEDCFYEQDSLNLESHPYEKSARRQQKFTAMSGESTLITKDGVATKDRNHS